MKVFFITSVFYLVTLTTKAYAYLDPGTGSIILTAIISSLAFLSFKIKTLFKKIKNFLKKEKRN